MNVRIPTPLRSYTGQAAKVDLDRDSGTLADVFADIERRYPGLRFRIVDEQNQIRQHIKVFVNEQQAADLGVLVVAGDTIHIICALSGG